jgi:thiamine biosynthesis lipoprotein
VGRLPRQRAELPRLGAAAALVAALAAPARAETPGVVSDGRYAMGTVLEIALVTADRERAEALLETLYAEVARLERILSNWDPTSDVSRLNAAAGQGPEPVAPELVDALALAIELAPRTRGSFDVTVGPLVALWREAGARGAPPTPEELARARAKVGADGLRIDRDAGTAELLRTEAVVELGGLAKGFALDRLADRVRAEGIPGALLSFGQSSLWAVGAPPDAEGWRLLVRRPDGGFAGVATLRDRAASVSASLGQATEVAGRRYGHVIDPRSGAPLEAPAEAMALAPSASRAEAWSKALLVLGAEEGLALLASEPGCEGLVVDASGRRSQTPGWQAATRFEALEEEAGGGAPTRRGPGE